MKSGLYKHYKGGYYQVLGVARHSETNERLVVYVSLDVSKPGPRLCVRPLKGKDGFEADAWDSEGMLVSRFQYIGDGFEE